MKRIFAVAFFTLGVGFIALPAFAAGGITMHHSSTIPANGGQVIVLEFLAEDFDACLDKLTLQTNIGTEELNSIGCSTATMGGHMRFFHSGTLPNQIGVIKAIGVKDGKTIDALSLLKPVDFKSIAIATTQSAAPTGQSMSQQIDSLLDDAEKMVKILEKHNGKPLATKEEIEFVGDMTIRMSFASQKYPDQYWSPAQLNRFRALATRLNKVPPTR